MEPTSIPTPTESSSYSTQSPVRILIVERGNKYSTLFPDYSVTTVSDGKTACEQLCSSPGYDVVLLDVPLADRSECSLLKEAKRRAIDSSFLIVSPDDRLQEYLREEGLGAEDYLVEPIDDEELRVRMEALICRRLAPGSYGSDVYTLDGLSIDLAENTCFRDGERIPLTGLESCILKFLVEHRGRIVSIDEIHEAIECDDDESLIPHIDEMCDKVNPDESSAHYIKSMGDGQYFFALPGSK